MENINYLCQIQVLNIVRDRIRDLTNTHISFLIYYEVEDNIRYKFDLSMLLPIKLEIEDFIWDVAFSILLDELAPN